MADEAVCRALSAAEKEVRELAARYGKPRATSRSNPYFRPANSPSAEAGDLGKGQVNRTDPIPRPPSSVTHVAPWAVFYFYVNLMEMIWKGS